MNKKKMIFAGLPALLFSLLIILFPALSTRLTDADVDILFKLRGSRAVSDEMVFVYIDSRDLQELNQWPITRDYYGYLTHVLKSLGARVVGYDILFTSENPRYPEYDQSFSEFLRTAQNVCLPFIFADLSDTFSGKEQSFYLGNSPQEPIDLFRQHILGAGFANLLDETMVRRCLLAANYSDTVYYSFGIELARLYKFGKNSKIQISPHHIVISDSLKQTSIATDVFSRVRLNHFGRLQNIHSMSLIDLFQTFQNHPEELDLKDKLVLVGVTAPGAAPIKVTPFFSSFPASLIHFTVAENVLNENFIRTTPTIITLLILLTCALLVSFFIAFRWQKIFVLVAVFSTFMLVAVLLFKMTAFALPILLPAITTVSSSMALLFIRYREQSLSEENVHALYQEQILQKQEQLTQAESNIQKLHTQQEQISAELQEDLAEKQQEILRLQKDLRDLLASTEKVTPALNPKYAAVIHAKTSNMAQVLQLVDKVSSDDIPVLISGETGTGKEVIARAIHESGKRANRSFIAVNCGALPETLLESELFGHEKGAFTGATSQRKGRFELADGGTLFLDEITETTAAFQAKLLRVLQEGAFERLGSEKTIKVNVRIIAASSKNIERQVQAEQFREDLFYRLNGFPIELPPLRDRQEDIPLLADHFLKKHGYKTITAFSKGALAALSSYRWPGNVRELENTVRRAAILAQSENRKMIREIDLPNPVQETRRAALQVSYQSFDEQILETLRSLKFSHSCINQTALALGNKDRGTITEYFRGLCFEFLVQASFDFETAAAALAATNDESVIDKVKTKMMDYVGKIEIDPTAKSLYKGLPKKYQNFLERIIDYISKNGKLVA